MSIVKTIFLEFGNKFQLILNPLLRMLFHLSRKSTDENFEEVTGMGVYSTYTRHWYV